MTATEPAVSVPLAGRIAPAKSVDVIRANNFDLVRLFGALQVALVHASEHLHATSLASVADWLGYFPGVPIFFAVSGFLVSLSLERATSIKQYCYNRALRIFPGLWACFVVALILVLVSGVVLPSFGKVAVWAVSQLTIVQFYNPGWLRGFGVGAVNGSLWTIPVELQFYALLPLLARWTGRQPRRWMVLLAGAGILMQLLRLLGPSHESLAGRLLDVSLAPYLFYFLVGVLLRYAYNAFPTVFHGKALWWCLAYLLWIALEIRFGLSGAIGNRLNVVSIVLLSSLAIAIAFTHITLSSRLLGSTDISYGVYIYHMPLINLSIVNGLVGNAGAASAIGGTLLLSLLSWRFVERPALRLKHYTLKSRQ